MREHTVYISRTERYGGNISLMPTNILHTLDDSGLLRSLVFQGGTAIQRAYGGSRLSEEAPLNPKRHYSVVAGARQRPHRPGMELAKKPDHGPTDRSEAYCPQSIRLRLAHEDGHGYAIRWKTGAQARNFNKKWRPRHRRRRSAAPTAANSSPKEQPWT